MQNSKNKIIIVDFEDSFTHNISEVLYSLGVKSIVVDQGSFFSKLDSSDYSKHPFNSEHKYGVILGPGPGHPSQYASLRKAINKLLNYSNVFSMGICLGHQLMWYSRGEQIYQRSMPVHGSVVSFLPPDWEIFASLRDNSTLEVQQYNSLCLKESRIKKNDQARQLFSINDEVLMTKGDRYFTTQFHPESIGTSFQHLFFGPIINFLYN